MKEVQVQSSSTVAQSYAIEEPDTGSAEALTAEPVIQGASLDSARDVLLGEIVNGGPVFLSQYRGNAVLVNYWSSSCGTCGDRLRDMSRLAVDYQPFGLVVANVNIGDDPGTAGAWLDAEGIVGFSGLQLSDDSGEASAGAGVATTPATLLFDRNGSEVMRYGQDSPPGRIRGDLDLLLK